MTPYDIELYEAQPDHIKARIGEALEELQHPHDGSLNGIAGITSGIIRAVIWMSQET